MPKGQSTKRDRDEALLREWDARPDAHFEPLGLTRDALKAAQLQLQGHIVLPGDPTYDTDRMLSNPAFSPAPSMIVFCATEADVAIALKLAQSSPMPFSVRSGGHCTAGFSAGYGVLIDVKALDSVTINVATMMATVGAGCDMGQLDQQLAYYGVHVPGGECDDVCVGGFVQGGGLGFTSTTFGMNCDNVIEMVVMLADGSIAVANSATNADLWYAMRGGTGGNFGVLLRVTYRLYPLGDVFGFALAWELQAADIPTVVNVLLFLQQHYMQASPYWPQLNLQALWVYQTIVDPKQPPLPAPVCVFMVRGLWVGDPSGGQAAMQPLAGLPGAIVQWTATDTYNNVLDKLLGDPQDQPIIDPNMGMPNEGKASRYVAQDLTAAQWTELVTYFVTKTPNTMSYMYLELYGGAIQNYSPLDNAFVHRTAFYDAVLDVFWYLPKDRPAAEAFLTGWINLMETVWNGEVYQNYASIDVPDYTSNYWASLTWFLTKIKRKYDPTNRFVFAQQVPFEPQSSTPPASTSQPDWLSAAIDSPIDYTGGVKAPGAPT
jgi:FAD/FMN-containing dehydrogenase